MRVVVTEQFTAYLNMQPETFTPGQEIKGVTALYLLNSGSAVEPADEEARQAAAPAADGDGDDGQGAGGEDSQAPPQERPAAGADSEVILAWVGSAPQRAAEEIEREEDEEDPREDLLARLQEIEAGDGYPAGASVDAVKTWAGTDPVRARIALDAEDASGKPRSTLVAHLTKLL
ncbi:hypothetical protein ACIOHE_15655 [Streptomyces sp. NPDC087851]|uniref:hypothetical protein n=1 Tax=Streptomyces sp. NPDC087851 TaxID=3365810 RepID=UPI0037F2316F